MAMKLLNQPSVCLSASLAPAYTAISTVYSSKFESVALAKILASLTSTFCSLDRSSRKLTVTFLAILLL